MTSKTVGRVLWNRPADLHDLFQKMDRKRTEEKEKEKKKMLWKCTENARKALENWCAAASKLMGKKSGD